MHRCWDVDELTRMIFEHVQGEPSHYDEDEETHCYRPGISREACLCRLAMACRKFSDPALDMLWEQLYGLLPVLKCLPPHTWEVSDVNPSHQKVTAPLQARHWVKALTYSKRVKSFTDNDRPLDKSVVESMVLSLPAGTLFSNVRDLRCESASELFPYLAFLVGPHVTRIVVELVGPVWRVAALPLIASSCLSLRHVNVYGPLDDNASEWVSPMVMQLVHLRTLRALSMNEHAYRHISGLKHLESLEILAIHTEPFPRTLPFVDSRFPSLSRFTLHAVSVNFAVNFLTVLDNAPLETMVIAAGGDSTAVSSLFSAMHSRSFTRHTTLTSITVRLNAGVNTNTVWADSASYTVSSDAIQPLLEFPNLRCVELSSAFGLCLDDEFVDAMALAWSQLESLIIKGQHSVMFDSELNPTIMSLHSFSRRCPHLRHLSLLVDATNVRMDHPSRMPRIMQRTLTSLNPLDSPIDSPGTVADLLSSIFPSLSHIQIRWNGNYAEGWKRVEELVPAFAAIRADERRIVTEERDSVAA